MKATKPYKNIAALRRAIDRGAGCLTFIMEVDLSDLYSLDGIDRLNDFTDERFDELIKDVASGMLSEVSYVAVGCRKTGGEGAVLIAVSGLTDNLEFKE